MTMSLQQFVYLVWLAPFAFGALAFCTLTVFYCRQLRQQRGAGGGVFRVFTAVCGLAFLLNLAAQAESLQTLVSPALDLATGMVPPLLLHLVYREEQCRLAWLRDGFYVLAIAVAGAMAGVDAGLLPAVWTDALEPAPALLLGAAGLLGLGLQMLSRRRANIAERRYRTWTRLLLCLMLLASTATLLQLSPAVRLLPDYLLLTFFCVTLYYKERLVFFDLVLKRGVFLAFSLLVLGTFFLLRPETAWGQWLVLGPLWLAGPWIYGLLARRIDRVWLRRRYTGAEAERLFVAAVQAAENEGDLRVRAARALSEIFEAAAAVRFGAAAAGEPMSEGGIGAAIGEHGDVALSPRANSLPYLSDDRNLLQSLARTLGVVLENVRFREREEHLRGLASRAELKALRAQINPHFLFNALNAIAGLIHTRPELAEETVEQLAEVFRYTLRKSEKEWVRLDEELEFVAAYLRVEEARFGERLGVTVSVDAAAAAIPVPAMSIQPLVENAIKHGTSAVEGQGRVGLRVTLNRDLLCIEVCDNGPGFPAGFSLAAPGNGHTHGTGHGLRNIAERLAGYYGDAAGISWENHAEGTVVWLKIPRRSVAGVSVVAVGAAGAAGAAGANLK